MHLSTTRSFVLLFTLRALRHGALIIDTASHTEHIEREGGQGWCVKVRIEKTYISHEYKRRWAEQEKGHRV